MTPEQKEHERNQQLASHLIQFSTFGTRCDVIFLITSQFSTSKYLKKLRP